MHSYFTYAYKFLICCYLICLLSVFAGCSTFQVADQMEVHDLLARSSLPFRQHDVVLLTRDGPVNPMLAVAIYCYCLVSAEEYSSRYLTSITSDNLTYYLHIKDRKNSDKVMVCIRKEDGRVYDPICGFWIRKGYVNTSETNLQAMFKGGTNIKEVYKILGAPAKINWLEEIVDFGAADVTLISYLTRTGWSSLAFKNNKLMVVPKELIEEEGGINSYFESLK